MPTVIGAVFAWFVQLTDDSPESCRSNDCSSFDFGRMERSQEGMAVLGLCAWNLDETQVLGHACEILHGAG